MGIQGLLPFLKKIHEPVNVSRFAGCTVAIDAYCWLHKGAFSCAEKLALGEKTDQYVYYCMKFINYLLAQNVKPVMVFDGCHLPSKKQVEKTRRERFLNHKRCRPWSVGSLRSPLIWVYSAWKRKRDANRKKAAQFLREGRRAEARECLQRSIDISPDMALNLMNVCRDRGVDCIVAPYEADSQLAYLNKIGVADVIITEDSDLLLFGCEKVLFKMDHAGNGVLIERRRLNEVTEIQSESYTFEKFRYMCIMSGCDYLASLPGIGLARANKVFKIARQADVQLLLKKLSTYLKSNITVPQDYIDSFVQADNTFLYQLVYDPLLKKLLPLNPYPPDISPGDLPYAGQYVQKDKALQIALGNINIYTGDLFANFDPETFVPKYAKKKSDMLYRRSIWDKTYRVKPKMALHEAQLSDRPLLKGKELTIKSNLKRHSPKKRLREAEESRDVKTDTELYSMYNNASPMKKKPRTEEEVDDLHRFMFASAESAQEGNHSEEEEDEKPLQTGPTRSPKFFSSLSKAHPGVTDLCTSQENESDKENGLTSPKKNIFAAKSPSKKQRFDLNAPKSKKVISRFFANSVKTDGKSGGRSPNKQSGNNQTLISGYRLVHHSDADTSENTACSSENTACYQSKAEKKKSPQKNSDTRKSGSPFTFSKEKLTSSQNSQNSSPGGAFQWSKFKFGSKDGSSISSPLTSSRTNKGFKKVVSESKLDEFLKSKPKDVEEKQCMGDKSGVLDHSGDEVISHGTDSVPESQEVSGLSASQSASSLPYSIDSYCVDTNQCDSQNSNGSNCYINSQESTGDAENSQKQKVCSIYGFKNVKRRSDICTSENMLKNDLGETSSGGSMSAGNSATTSEKDRSSVTSERDTTKEEVSPTDVIFLLDSDEEKEGDTYPTSRQLCLSDKRIPTTSQKTAAKGSGKPGCRVSGLSRKTSKKALPAIDSRQQNLKDMFKKFAHADGAKPRLSHHLSGESETGENPSTPEGNTSLIQNKNLTLQRKLLDTS